MYETEQARARRKIERDLSDALCKVDKAMKRFPSGNIDGHNRLGAALYGAQVALTLADQVIKDQPLACGICDLPRDEGRHDWCDAEMHMIMNAEGGDDDV